MVNNQTQKQKNESVEKDKYGVQFVFDSMYEKYKERQRRIDEVNKERKKNIKEIEKELKAVL
jgi:hypothetical protein